MIHHHSHNLVIPTLHLLLFLLLNTTQASAATTTISSSDSKTPKPTPLATPIYINALRAYSSLPPCAEVPLSNIVRNMWSGCGDDSQLTSFSCFCTDSYSKFSWEISTAVVDNCDNEKEDLASSAVDVFHEYCTRGTEQLTQTAGRGGRDSPTTTIGGVSASTTSPTSSSTPAPQSPNPFQPAQTQTSSALTNQIRTLSALILPGVLIVLGSVGLP